MRLLPDGLARGRIVSVASLCVISALSVSCSAASRVASTSTSTSTSTSPAAPSPAARADGAFTVAGARPVVPNGSQDTHTATPEAACDSTTFAADEAVGNEVADGFSAARFPAAASLLRHFLAGAGTEIDYRAGSPISREARASSEFQAVNAEVQAAVALQLKAGDTRVELSAAQLPTVLFGSTGSDLYWGFRGTQGLSVTGKGSRDGGRYVGTLTYVIRDSYGFPADDTLAGFGPPMRYLQTVCGAPQHVGGARWFPDTITVTLPFDRVA
jgi:hypothetical protein